MPDPKASIVNEDAETAEDGSGDEARDVPENRLGEGENGIGEPGLLP